MKRGTQPIEFQVPGSRWSLARRAMINDDRTRIVVKKRTSLLVLPGNPRKGCQFPLNVSTWALCPLRAAFGAVIVGRINRTRTTLLLSLCVPRVAASKRFRTFWTKKMPPLLTRQSRFWTCDTKASWMDEAREKKSQVKNHRKKRSTTEWKRPVLAARRWKVFFCREKNIFTMLFKTFRSSNNSKWDTPFGHNIASNKFISAIRFSSVRHPLSINRQSFLLNLTFCFVRRKLTRKQ